MNPQSPHSRTLFRLLLVGGSLALLGSRPTLAQNGEEWYDPTDWFDAKNVKSLLTDDYGVYEYEYDYGLGENFDYAEWSTYGRWGYEVWNANDYDADYWDSQDWYDDTKSLAEPVGGTYPYVIYAQPRRSPRQTTPQRERQQTRSEEREERQQRQQQREESGERQGQQQEGRKQVARLDGTVVGLRNMQLRRESGATGTYTIAKVRLENGKNTAVSLGRESQVEDLNLKKGDTIQAIGRRGKIAGENVFVAHRLKAGNRTIDANPTVRLSGESEQTLTGTVANIRKAAPGSAKRDHTLVDLKLENGRSVTLDLGPAVSLEKIDLQQGERITVRGETKDQDGRSVFVPELLKIEDEQTTSDSK